MLNSLDFMMIVFAGMMVMALVSIGAVFLKKKTIRSFGFYLMTALTLYISSVGMYITGVMFPGQMVLCAIAGILGIAAVILKWKGNDTEAGFRLARLVSLAALALAIPSAFL